MDPVSQVTCYRHPDRNSGVSCQRCERPVCPACMVQASVGFQCPECAGANRTRVISGPAAFASSSSDLIATKVIIAVNALVYVFMVARGGDMNSASGPVYLWGATYGPSVAAGEWYRIASGAFMHSGILHLGMNMFLLYLLGKVLEPALGRAQFTMLYVASLLGGAVGVMLLSPDAPTVGASGAIFGLMGALVVLQLRAGHSPWESGIITLVALNLVITFALPGISIGGHLGGLVVGSLAALGLSNRPGRDGVPLAARLGALAVLSVVLAVAAVIVAQHQFPQYVGV